MTSSSLFSLAYRSLIEDYSSESFISSFSSTEFQLTKEFIPLNLSFHSSSISYLFYHSTPLSSLPALFSSDNPAFSNSNSLRLGLDYSLSVIEFPSSAAAGSAVEEFSLNSYPESDVWSILNDFRLLNRPLNVLIRSAATADFSGFLSRPEPVAVSYLSDSDDSFTDELANDGSEELFTFNEPNDNDLIPSDTPQVSSPPIFVSPLNRFSRSARRWKIRGFQLTADGKLSAREKISNKEINLEDSDGITIEISDSLEFDENRLMRTENSIYQFQQQQIHSHNYFLNSPISPKSPMNNLNKGGKSMKNPIRTQFSLPNSALWIKQFNSGSGSFEIGNRNLINQFPSSTNDTDSNDSVNSILTINNSNETINPAKNNSQQHSTATKQKPTDNISMNSAELNYPVSSYRFSIYSPSEIQLFSAPTLSSFEKLNSSLLPFAVDNYQKSNQFLDEIDIDLASATFIASSTLESEFEFADPQAAVESELLRIRRHFRRTSDWQNLDQFYYISSSTTTPADPSSLNGLPTSPTSVFLTPQRSTTQINAFRSPQSPEIVQTKEILPTVVEVPKENFQLPTIPQTPTQTMTPAHAQAQTQSIVEKTPSQLMSGKSRTAASASKWRPKSIFDDE